MKKVFLLFAIAIFSQPIFAQNSPPARQAQPVSQTLNLAQYGVKIEPDKRLIIVMATLEAGGATDTKLTQPGENFRRTLQADSQNTSADLQQKIKTFVEQYKKRHPAASAAELNAPFVSLAYALGPAPELADPPRDVDLPAEVLEILSFGALAREFYKTPGIAEKLPDYVKLYQAEGDKMRLSAGEMVGELLDYLHTRPDLTIFDRVKTQETEEKNKKKTETKISTTERARRFFIVPDLLAPTGTINFRNIGDDYYAIVPPDTNLSVSEVRRAYLQFVTDPLVLKNAKDIAPLRDKIKKLLDERQQAGATVSPDVFLAVSRSLVAAVDAKQIEYEKTRTATAEARRQIEAAKDDAAKKAVAAQLFNDKQSFADQTALKLAESYERGAVLDFYFAEQLKGLEDSGFDIAGSFRNMILALDPARESARLAQFDAARQRALARRAVNLDKNLELPKELIEIDALIKNKSYVEADTRLRNLLASNPSEPRIYYTLGRVASISAEGTFDEQLLSERLGRAAAYYRNAILAADKNTDPALLSLAHVALGRILKFNDQPEAALVEYEAAIALGKVSGGAYDEAVALKAELTKKPQ